MPHRTLERALSRREFAAIPRKGLILIGHWVSEDQGMRLCADWLKSFVPEVPVEWIAAGDPFWRP
jgi:hypothetical protein